LLTNIYIDIKKLGGIGSVGRRITGRQSGVVNRHVGIGWKHAHVCIEDASRVASCRSWPISVKKAPSPSWKPQLSITASSKSVPSAW
jgi:hypothetical protein